MTQSDHHLRGGKVSETFRLELGGQGGRHDTIMEPSSTRLCQATLNL